MLDLKKIVNLNSYEWWRNHRRFITLGLFIALAAVHVRAPIARDFQVKDTCSRLWASMITFEEASIRLKVSAKTTKTEPSPVQLKDNIRAYCSKYGSN
tara:strand:+ start:155 stop:448 length:294 start_codon:yes stop_codon:yes gene_type:complete